MAKKPVKYKSGPTGIPVKVVNRGKDGKVKSSYTGTSTSGVKAKEAPKKKGASLGTKVMDAVTRSTAAERAKMNKDAKGLAKEVVRKVKGKK